MATIKSADTVLTLGERHQELLNKYRPIKKRYYVYEYTPAYQESGYYGQWVYEKTIRVSPYFDDAADASEWRKNYDPTPGSTFKIGADTLYEHTERTWMPGDWINNVI